MSFPNDYAGVHKALTSGKHVSQTSELGARFHALAEAIRNGGEPKRSPKPGLFDLLRSRKKPAPLAKEPGLLAS
jgi:hypothetical protein